MTAVHTTQFWRSRQESRRPAAFFTALVVFIIVILAAAPQAQQPLGFTPNGASSPAVREAASGTEIDLLVGRSTIINIGSAISRVSLTVPDVADALVTAPTQLLIHGKQPGTISLFVWDKAGTIKTYEVSVRRDLSVLGEHLRQLFPGEGITVLGSGKDVVLSGTVSSKYVTEKAAEVAAGYVDKKESVVNLLKQQEGVASNQVMLRVRFAEVSRSAMQELGASFFASGYKSDWFGRTAPDGVPAPDFDADRGLVFSDFLNVFVFNAKEGLGGVVRALSNKGLFQSLAEPNLIATNGKEASFLAGGEYPYPVVQPSSGGNAVTIVFKEFGIRLNFTPTVLGGDLINLKVRPEVSSLDFSNAIILEGFRIPALTTRRTETEVELRDGQTFAIAGLLNNTLNTTMSKIPGIGDIPILGYLFRSKQHQKNQTELVVMITPTILRRGQTGVSEGLPTLVEPYLGAPNKSYPVPDPYVGSPRYPATQSPRGNDDNAPSASVPVPGSSTATTAATAPSAATSDTPPSAKQPVASRPLQQPLTTGNLAPGPVSAPETSNTPTPSRVGTQGSPTPGVAPVPLPTMPVAALPGTTSASLPVPATPEASQPAPLTKAQMKALEKAREQERKAEQAEAKQRAQEEKRAAEVEKRAAEAEQKRRTEEARKAEADKRQAERVEKERVRREAEIAKRNVELEKKKTDEDQKRDKGLADAATRLKLAQEAYQAELEKTKGGTNEKKDSGSSVKGSSPSGSKQ